MNIYRDIELEIEPNNREIEIGMESGGSGRLPPYTGDYNVTPQL